MLTGYHLIAGEWVAGEVTFASSPATGTPHRFSVGTPAHVDRACRAAEEAFWSYSAVTNEDRARLLDRIADEVEARGAAITEIGHQESGLPTARLEGERARTTGQLRLFAAHIRNGLHLDRRHDPAQPDRKPLPRPELTLIQRPIGPVAVFGASNFPLAFSVAGGDTASALAAGCPVVVKGHSAHPGTGELVAQAIHAAIQAEELHPGVFSLIQGGRRDVGEALVRHPLIRAVGFTGSLVGGRALFDLCVARTDPIPFFGELGSVNPMFLLPGALAARGEDLARGWAGSLTMGAGQFCTNPGIAVVIDGPDADRFVASAYRDGQRRIASGRGVRELLVTSCDMRTATPYLYEVAAADWLSDHALADEVFGPLGLVVRARDAGEVEDLARGLNGQLTCTLHMQADDRDAARRLLPILERKAGRIIANGFPTGVEVADAMVHGGPYPASTNFGHTSVGTMSIRRWLRPVCYQGFTPEHGD